MWDVRDAADAIIEFVQGIDYDGYAASPLIQAAVERKFEIIGEALNQLKRSDPRIASQIADADQIIAFRHILIHGYAVVDQTRVGDILKHHLPELRATAERLLADIKT